MLKKIDPRIKAVKGQPRKPSDQGSIEFVNKQIQKILAKLESQDKLNGFVFNWTHNLGRVAASMNSMKQKSSGRTSGFATIYGMQFLNTEICVHQEELGRCMTMTNA